MKWNCPKWTKVTYVLLTVGTMVMAAAADAKWLQLVHIMDAKWLR